MQIIIILNILFHNGMELTFLKYIMSKNMIYKNR